MRRWGDTTWAEPDPRPLESVSLDDAIGSFFTLLRIAEAKQSDHDPKRVVPSTTNARVAELRAMSYAAYLATPEWHATSAEMKWLTHKRCESCGEEQHLNVHHLTYERLGAELASDLIVLCERCHLTFHRVMPA